MTTEQKAKAYDEAITTAKQILSNNCSVVEKLCIECVLPELKESEDDRIRKELLEFLDELSKLGKNTNFDRWSKSDCADWIIWLEKQGETYTKKDIDNAYLEGMAFAKDELEKQNKQILANSAKTCKDEQQPTDNDMKELLHTEYEKGRADAIAEMQKPTWCEDDEKIGKELIGFCIKCSQGNTVVSSQDDFTRWVTWLKSLKERYTWKPSDEQMKALKYVAYHLMPDNNYREEMFSLYEQLKKLK